MTQTATDGQLSIGEAPPRILVTDPIADDGLARLREAGHVDVATGIDPEELVRRIGDYEALVVRSETKVTARVLEAATRLRVVGRAGTGVDNIDVDAATRAGVLVLNAPTGNTIAAAEHAVAMMLSMARNIAAADASLHSGRWERGRFMGSELRGKCLGLLGLGKIGFEVARIAGQGLQMRVLAHDPLVATERAKQAGAELCDLDTLLREADVLSVHVPLNDRTRGCVGAEQLRRMKRGARVVNVARGGIIDEAALAEAVRSGHLAGAAVDVFEKEPVAPDNPLLSVAGVVVTPHLGASTHEAQVNVAADVADQIAAVLSGNPARYAVNAPTILPEEMAGLLPYLELARRMGSMAAQLAGGKLRRVTCSYSGQLAEGDTTVLTAAALSGVFADYAETRINTINAHTVARSLGVDVDERRTTHSPDYDTAAMAVEVQGAETVRIGGAAFEGRARVTRINEFHVDMEPAGHFLVSRHRDRPGVVAVISAVLAEHQINIAGVMVGRTGARQSAVMLVQVDEPVTEELLAEMHRAPGLETLRTVQL